MINNKATNLLIQSVLTSGGQHSISTGVATIKVTPATVGHKFEIWIQQETAATLSKHAVAQNLFRRISCAAITQVLRTLEYKFTAAFHVLSNIESQRAITSGNGAGEIAGINPTIKVFIKRNRATKYVVLHADRDALLLKEINAIPELNTKNNSYAEHALATSERDDSNSVAKDKSDAPIVDCLCCYGEYPLFEMRECTAGHGHLVCIHCINNYVSEQLDGNGSITFKCIVDVDCECEYSMSLLEEEGVLSSKLKDRVNDRVFREMIKQAGIENGW